MKTTIVNEITIYLSNQAGELARLTKSLAQAGVSIRGVLVSGGFGKSVVRLVLDQEGKALPLLKSLGFEIAVSPILEVIMPSRVGIIFDLSDALGKENINIENLYVTESTGSNTLGYVDVTDVEAAQKVLEKI